MHEDAVMRVFVCLCVLSLCVVFVTVIVYMGKYFIVISPIGHAHLCQLCVAVGMRVSLSRNLQLKSRLFLHATRSRGKPICVYAFMRKHAQLCVSN